MILGESSSESDLSKRHLDEMRYVNVFLEILLTPEKSFRKTYTAVWIIIIVKDRFNFIFEPNYLCIYYM